MDAKAEEEDGTGPFGRPLFADSSARALARVGVVDVGSNSVRLVVFDGAARSPAYFYNEKVMCALGQGLAESGRLNPVGRTRALAALRRFALLAAGMGLPPLTCVATAAVREAADGPEFRAEVQAATGLRLWVIDGAEEARLSAQGVLLGWPGAEGLVCDIGGASLELAVIARGRVGARVSTPLGPFRLQAVPGGREGLKTHLRTVLEGAADRVGRGHERLYLVGGSWRAFARLDIERRGYPLTVLHEYRMTPKAVRLTQKWIAEGDLALLRARTDLSAERIEHVPLAGDILRQLLRVFQPAGIAVSAYGVREGMLYEQMPEAVRARDPLIEACRFMEASAARIPGNGDCLFDFLRPLYRSAPPERLRLIRAACLLHDVNWRAHPDYRAEVCFDTATRANMGGLDHPGRVFLGLALLYRYRNSRAGTRMEPLVGLLSPAEVSQAEALGRALRFGAMFAFEGINDHGRLGYFPKKRRLELVLSPRSRELYGEVAAARFAALAAALGVAAEVRTDPG
ncbi:MAG: Ppx/GppA family phosphatase [Rhodobacteraceae bacterium]|nr:Ppx/GppA family phosphatase [Paracoccaceae bacterium]